MNRERKVTKSNAASRSTCDAGGEKGMLLSTVRAFVVRELDQTNSLGEGV